MKVSIHQTIHGYQHGHQLLGSSIDLELESRNTLLFQSDLSGSMVDLGFNEYLTGYPLQKSNVYVFAKTWYASEMRRPGCVWTHSLLIELADLGKIPELDLLTSFFMRPNGGGFDRYTDVLELDIIDTIRSASFEKKIYTQKKLSLIDALYSNPSKAIIVPTLSSAEWEKETLQIWSDQWPRLRRNFRFCTGALSFKTIDGIGYDLQIVPKQNLVSVERKADNSVILDSQKSVYEPWIDTLVTSDKEKLRRFLWKLGANVDGNRQNFIFLMTLFSLAGEDKVSPGRILSYIQSQFPGTEKGRFLKKTLFGSDNFLQLEENELLDYILTNGEGVLNYDDLQISDRIARLIDSGQLGYHKLSRWLKNEDSRKILKSVWDNVIPSDDTVIELINDNSSFVQQFALRLPELAGSINTWHAPMKTQVLILNELFSLNFPIDWVKIIRAVLEARSEAIFELRGKIGESVTFLSLDWATSSNRHNFSYKWEQYLIKRDSAFKTWLSAPRNFPNKYIFGLVFQLAPKEFETMPFDANALITAYENLDLNDSTLHKKISYTLLAVGLNNKIPRSYLLVEKFFPKLYEGLYESKFGGEIWNIISKEKPVTDEEPINFLTFFSWWDKKKSPQFKVDPWDHARFLVVKTVNAFIRHSWPIQSFAVTFKEKKEFNDAIYYCLTFEAGNRFLKYLLSEIEKKNVKLASSQKQFFR